jgi:small nuclear ribonucleoprotein (snRNP)-like protein
MLDFWVPMVLVFVTATVAAIAARRKRDRCLKFLNFEKVLILLNSNKWLWGKLTVFPHTMELVYDAVEQDGKASYILYQSEIDQIKKIIQPTPNAGTPEFDAWRAEVDRIANPSAFRQLRRYLWNAFNTLRDAISQSLSLLLGTLKTKTPMGKISSADKRAGEIGNTLISSVPNAYEPVLEKYLGKTVVVEMLEGDTVEEFTGLLQEYSGAYLLLRNVHLEPDVDTGKPLPERFDVVFPRRRALVRHCLG